MSSDLRRSKQLLNRPESREVAERAWRPENHRKEFMELGLAQLKKIWAQILK